MGQELYEGRGAVPPLLSGTPASNAARSSSPGTCSFNSWGREAALGGGEVAASARGWH